MDAENVTFATEPGVIQGAAPEAEQAVRSTGHTTSTASSLHGVRSPRSRNSSKANGRTVFARSADPKLHTIKTVSGEKHPFARNAEQ